MSTRTYQQPMMSFVSCHDLNPRKNPLFTEMSVAVRDIHVKSFIDGLPAARAGESETGRVHTTARGGTLPVAATDDYGRTGQSKKVLNESCHGQTRENS